MRYTDGKIREAGRWNKVNDGQRNLPGWRRRRLRLPPLSLPFRSSAVLPVLLVAAFLLLNQPLPVSAQHLKYVASNLRLSYDQVNPQEFPKIVSYVTVNDDSGFTVGELTEDHFVVHEDGVRELPIEVVELTDSIGISVVLAIDRSTSMKGQPIIDAKNAASTFVQLMNSKDLAAIVSFASTVRTDHEFSSDKSSLLAAIDGIQAKGGTAIYDAVIHSARLIKPIVGRRAIIFLTDGHDKDSQSTFQEAVDAVKPLGVPVFTIGLNLSRNSDEEKVLIDLARATGGRYYHSPNSDELDDIYRAISALLHHAYRITYTTHNPAHDGTIRHVKIDVNALGGSAADTASYRAPLDLITVAATSRDIPAPSREFLLQIEIPQDSYPAFFMRDLHFTLKYDAAFLQLPQPHAAQIHAGALYGGDKDHSLNVSVDENKGEIAVNLQKFAAAGFVNGHGQLLTVRFMARETLPDDYALHFRLQQMQAMNKDDKIIPTIPRDLTVRSYGWVTLELAAADRCSPGRPFRLDVNIAPDSKAIPDLASITFELQYDKDFLAARSPLAEAVAGGALFGGTDEYTLNFTDDKKAGRLSVTLAKNAGRAPAKGRGQLARAALEASPAMPDSTILHFSLKNVRALDSSGWEIPVRVRDLTLASYGLIVWPGDTNHNGRVELTDVTVLGVYWALSGPGRPDEPDPLAWRPQFSGRYEVHQAAYADADGNGEISERDLIPIGLNWRRQTTAKKLGKESPAFASPLPGAVIAIIRPAAKAHLKRLVLAYVGDSVALSGVTFRLRYNPQAISLRDAIPGSFWQTQLLEVKNLQAGIGAYAAGMMLPGTARVANDSVEVVELLFETKQGLGEQNVVFEDCALVTADGTVHEVEPVFIAHEFMQAPPETFAMHPAYPNPFNPETHVLYDLPEPGQVEVEVFNALGKRVFRALRHHRLPGRYFWVWRGTNSAGGKVGSGTYFVRLEAALESGARVRKSQRLTVLR